jgi:hypothetical protein
MMRTTTAIAAVALAALVVSTPASAGQRSRGAGRSGSGGSGHQSAAPAGRAVARGPVRTAPRGGSYYRGGYSYRPYSYYRPYFYTPYGRGLNFSLFYGYPGYYGYGYPGAYGGYYGAYPYGYGAGYGAGYGYGGTSGYVTAAPGRGYGGVRIDLPERDAEVYVDGYYAGIVDDFDGALQHLELEAGPHHVEIKADGFEPVAFDVNVEPGRTITYRTQLRH